MTVGELFVLFSFQTDTNSIKKAQDALKGFANAAKAYLTAAAVGGMERMVEGAAKVGTEVLSLSKQFGISTAAVQEWGYVATRSGSNMREFGVAISQLERNLRLFAEGKGSKEVRRTFEQFGISQAEAAKSLNAPNGLNEVIFSMADRAKAMGSSMDVASGVTVLAGRRARGFAADLSQGSAAMREQIARVHELGGVLGNKQLADLKNVDNTLEDVRLSLHGLTLQAVAAFGPSFAGMLKGAAAWLQKNRDLIMGGLTIALRVFEAVMSGVGTVISAVGNVIKSALGGDDGAIAIVTGLAAAIAAVLIPALVAMAVPALVALAPFLAIAAAVALVTLGVIELVKHADDIQDALGDAWDWVQEKADDFADWLESLPGRAWDAVKSAGQYIKDEIRKAFDFVVVKANSTWEAIKGIPVIGDVIKGIGTATSSIPTTAAAMNARYGAGAGASAFVPYHADVGPRSSSSSTAVSITNSGATNIIVKSVEEAIAVKERLIQRQTDNALRHAATGTNAVIQ